MYISYLSTTQEGELEKKRTTEADRLMMKRDSVKRNGAASFCFFVSHWRNYLIILWAHFLFGNSTFYIKIKIKNIYCIFYFLKNRFKRTKELDVFFFLLFHMYAYVYVIFKQSFFVFFLKKNREFKYDLYVTCIHIRKYTRS